MKLTDLIVRKLGTFFLQIKGIQNITPKHTHTHTLTYKSNNNKFILRHLNTEGTSLIIGLIMILISIQIITIISTIIVVIVFLLIPSTKLSKQISDS